MLAAIYFLKLSEISKHVLLQFNFSKTFETSNKTCSNCEKTIFGVK